MAANTAGTRLRTAASRLIEAAAELRGFVYPYGMTQAQQDELTKNLTLFKLRFASFTEPPGAPSATLDPLSLKHAAEYLDDAGAVLASLP